MPPIADLIAQGATNLWVFIPTAIFLGALHGLEPGHSKTMMASFVIAVKGSMGQAALLGLCAALSHSLVVWLLALAALSLGNELMAEQAEPYFMLLSAVVVLGVAVWMWQRTRQDIAASQLGPAHHHDHDHGQPNDPHHRPSQAAFQDAHERAHAEDIARRFQGQAVTTGQIAVFGLTAGLVPCPASVTILMICLHLKRLTLGLVMVASFSLGLAIALVGVGVLAAWGAKQVDRQWGNRRWGEMARQMPYLSSALMAAVALWMGAHAAMRIAGL